MPGAAVPGHAAAIKCTALGCVARRDRADDREVRHRSARLAVEHDRSPVDRWHRCRVPDARRLLRADRGQPQAAAMPPAPSVATTTALASMRTPPCSQSGGALDRADATTRPGSRPRREMRGELRGDRPHPVRRERRRPFDASVRNITSNMRLEVVSDRSSWMPPNSGSEEPIDGRLREAAVPQCRRCRDVRAAEQIGSRLRQQGATEPRHADLVGQRPDRRPSRRRARSVATPRTPAPTETGRQGGGMAA